MTKKHEKYPGYNIYNEVKNFFQFKQMEQTTILRYISWYFIRNIYYSEKS